MIGRQMRGPVLTPGPEVYQDPPWFGDRGSFAYVIILSDSPVHVNPSLPPKVPKTISVSIRNIHPQSLRINPIKKPRTPLSAGLKTQLNYLTDYA
jgi:hypothetical protein